MSGACGSAYKGCLNTFLCKKQFQFFITLSLFNPLKKHSTSASHSLQPEAEIKFGVWDEQYSLNKQLFNILFYSYCLFCAPCCIYCMRFKSWSEYGNTDFLLGVSPALSVLHKPWLILPVFLGVSIGPTASLFCSEFKSYFNNWNLGRK